jgi:hypothetical protein
VIVVLGSPSAAPTLGVPCASGAAPLIARSAAACGAAVEVVGRIGDDGVGDAVLLDLAAAAIGHVAVLRAPGAATPIDAASVATDDGALSSVLDDADATAERVNDDMALPIDAGDVDLALRYLPDYRVIVVAADLDAAGWSTVIAAASWSGAHLVGVVRPGEEPADVPHDATILQRPHTDDGSFAAMVGRYAAALDSGDEPAAAFASASTDSGWATVRD